VQFSDITNRQFVLAEFFRAWGVSFDSFHLGRDIAGSGKTLSMKVNGSANTKFDGYVVKNGDAIELRFE
jgi:hypothetical protein